MRLGLYTLWTSYFFLPKDLCICNFSKKKTVRKRSLQRNLNSKLVTVHVRHQLRVSYILSAQPLFAWICSFLHCMFVYLWHRHFLFAWKQSKISRSFHLFHSHPCLLYVFLPTVKNGQFFIDNAWHILYICPNSGKVAYPGLSLNWFLYEMCVCWAGCWDDCWKLIFKTLLQARIF